MKQMAFLALGLTLLIGCSQNPPAASDSATVPDVSLAEQLSKQIKNFPGRYAAAVVISTHRMEGLQHKEKMWDFYVCLERTLYPQDEGFNMDMEEMGPLFGKQTLAANGSADLLYSIHVPYQYETTFEHFGTVAIGRPIIKSQGESFWTIGDMELIPKLHPLNLNYNAWWDTHRGEEFLGEDGETYRVEADVIGAKIQLGEAPQLLDLCEANGKRFTVRPDGTVETHP
ncbi:MAG: hypothetical protein H6617_07690 [Bdellovibrionaceae bacterium]|nr:hypothetical protein [Pseudobdellovibrionaceae bacterium]